MTEIKQILPDTPEWEEMQDLFNKPVKFKADKTKPIKKKLQDFDSGDYRVRYNGIEECFCHGHEAYYRRNMLWTTEKIPSTIVRVTSGGQKEVVLDNVQSNVIARQATLLRKLEQSSNDMATEFLERKAEQDLKQELLDIGIRVLDNGTWEVVQ